MRETHHEQPKTYTVELVLGQLITEYLQPELGRPEHDEIVARVEEIKKELEDDPILLRSINDQQRRKIRTAVIESEPSAKIGEIIGKIRDTLSNND